MTIVNFKNHLSKQYCSFTKDQINKAKFMECKEISSYYSLVMIIDVNKWELPIINFETSTNLIYAVCATTEPSLVKQQVLAMTIMVYHWLN